MEPTDAELIAGCRDGDNTAWEELVRRFRRLIYAIPRRSGLDEDASAEVFQQTFTILVKNIGTIKQPAQIRAWLVTTAKRETIRLIREHRSRATVSGDGDEESDAVARIADPAPLADEELARLELQTRVRNAVLSLDEKCRRLLELLFYRTDAPTYAEIASALGISEGSIGPTRARCLQKAMQRLG